LLFCTDASEFCTELGSDLFNLLPFVNDADEAEKYLSAVNSTVAAAELEYLTVQTNPDLDERYIFGGSGTVQKIVASALLSQPANKEQYFNVDLNNVTAALIPGSDNSISFLVSCGGWGDVADVDNLYLGQFFDATNNQSDQCVHMKADYSTTYDTDVLMYQTSNCEVSYPPLCMRKKSGNDISITGPEFSEVKHRKIKTKNSKEKLLRWKQKRNKRRKMTGFSNRIGQNVQKNKYTKETVKERWSADKNVAVEYAGEGRQFQGEGTPVEMCIPVAILLTGACVLFPALCYQQPTLSDPAPPEVIQPTPTPTQVQQLTIETLSPIQDFPTFEDVYQKAYNSPAEREFRQGVFLSNLNTVNTHNLLYIAGQTSYFVAINSFSDLTFNEFVASFTGVGLFKPLANLTNPVPAQFQTRGSLPTNPQPPLSVDFSQSVCKSRIRQQICNSCSAQSAISSVEYCLCLAGENNLKPRSIQQISECTDALGLDEGSQLERVNQHCLTGFPDVHMSYIVGTLNGRVETEELLPEFEENFGCVNEIQEPTTARVVDYISDYFTTEDYLVDSLTFGPTSTNIAVTPMLQLYGGGIYYNPEECDDYTEEIVPQECQEIRGGKAGYTCLNVNGVNCADLMPYHCDLLFKQKSNVYSHSITAVGYGQDTDGTQFWRLKNSWGEEWGEGGFIRFAKGLGHCNIGTFFALPQCSL